jgi:hypothetical protein
MKFTNAFLTALLFCGVTPLAIDKKRDEHGLTKTPIPFATPLSVALVTPNNAGVGDITDGTHGALEARKPNTKPAAEPKTKPKTKPKGKADTTCSAKKKKAGQCPDQEKKKKNWEVLTPTKGCTPKSCKNCGKAEGAKSDKKGGKKTIRESLHSPILFKRAATAEPASKTEAGLMAWTKDVWASSPKILHMPENSFKPTSFFVKWSSLGKGINFVTVKSLMGCKSRKGTR